MPSSPSKTLETFPNPEPGRDYLIEIETPEFTCLCPKTGQPDFATLHLEYVPDRLCVELKSLKLYFWSFRNEGHFHEKVTNTILDDLVRALDPRYIRLRAEFNVRGGLYTTVTAEHRKPGWNAPPPPPSGLSRVRQSAREARPSAAAAGAREGEDDPAPAPPAAGAMPGDSTPTARAPVARAERFRMLPRGRGAAAAAAAEIPPAPAAAPRDIYIGIDLGTTGCRALAINAAEKILGHAEAPLPAPIRRDGEVTQDPADWWKAAAAALRRLLAQIDTPRIRRIAVAGTSGTLVLVDKTGMPVTPGLMYNDARAQTEAARIAEAAGDQSAAFGAGSSLAKLLWLQARKIDARAAHALHPADWIAGRFMGKYGHSDYHNCLKLGYDAVRMAWPDWFGALRVPTGLLPQVHAPGDVLGRISPETAQLFGLPPDTEVAAGTTDGVAAFLATGASEPGHGVTVLGSTIVLKVLAETPIASAANGAYSHRLGRYWLAGGASNSGGNVLAQYFTPEQLREMTPLLDPDTPTGLNYYPLIDIGERFPVNDPNRPPKLEPLPGDSLVFLQGMLEGMARIEADGYAVLTELGAPPLRAVWTTGSGSQNPAWTRIRARTLGVPLRAPRSPHPAFGAALVAAGILARAYA
ncbi:MAG TPA: preQ(1) synthase [Burkholderiales bacterium]